MVASELTLCPWRRVTPEPHKALQALLVTSCGRPCIGSTACTLHAEATQCSSFSWHSTDQMFLPGQFKMPLLWSCFAFDKENSVLYGGALIHSILLLDRFWLNINYNPWRTNCASTFSLSPPPSVPTLSHPLLSIICPCPPPLPPAHNWCSFVTCVTWMHRRVVLWDWELMHFQAYVYIIFVYRVVYVDMSTRSSQLNHLSLES